MGLTPVLAFVLLIAAACGGDDVASVASGDDRGQPDSPPGAASDARYTATTEVLESRDHGPQLCLGIVASSYPPQCGGPDVIGWDWADVDGEESASGSTWGTYTVVGTWDGQALTLTEPAAPPAPSNRDRSTFSTPCPEPEGGWRMVDASATSDASMQAAIEYGRAQPMRGGVWLDQSINPALDDEPLDESRARWANDPTKLILNLSFTDDLERHEAEIREIWGGALCVSKAAISAAELAKIRGEVEADVGPVLWSSANEVEGRVEIGVPVDDGLQERFDKRYGVGVVKIQAQLVPVDA